MRRALLAALLGATLLVQPLSAQFAETATLVADRVEIAGDNRLVATGNIEVIQGDARLTARRIVYDASSETLQIDGPILLTEGAESVILADEAELSTDLRNGLLRSARLVLDEQLQLAAAEINRVDGRYTQLTKTVVSACEVCPSNPVPLWAIRAGRVIHDEEERQLYFENARFEIVGLPVAYIPRLRLPDPSVERARGFLTPEFRSTDQLGFGVKLPYFIPIGASKDLTVTPYVSANRTQTLELRYRQAFRSGDLLLNGAITRDDIVDGNRGYLFGSGEFSLPRDLTLSFDIETTSDDAYLVDYDYSGKDRLDSAIVLERVARDEYLSAEIIAYESLRSSEDNETQPYIVGDARATRRFEPALIGGTGAFTLAAHGHERRSNDDGIGRDVGRVSAIADWNRGWVGPAGILLSAETRLRFDHTTVAEDSTFDEDITRFTPAAAVELRWPLVRTGSAGAGQVLEPVAQIVYTPEAGEGDTPQDESTQLELDEGNLFAFSRYPAADRIERGLRANLGLTWTRYDPAGWSFGVTAGRIVRAEDTGQFDGYDILEDTRSDWLAATQLALPEGFRLTNRALFDDGFEFTRHEARLDWTRTDLDLSATYIWMKPSLIENRTMTNKEWTVSADYQATERWKTGIDVRYDMQVDRAASARVALEYKTDCVTVDLGVRRRFTSSDAIRPTTDVEFGVSLAGFGGTDRADRPRRRACTR
ncbi:LPS-assembly protein LptD [Tropicimonas sp. IMCC34011]|uniref:LPS-assembly protein LptD n=1 Tax=Tropicimonas sp. IMCC34011 TaxID=2248759 RepID=UPI000E23FD6E|nr:LPS assembly protein LptD [Tropicimonas sp. IMCC34011]